MSWYYGFGDALGKNALDETNPAEPDSIASPGLTQPACEHSDGSAGLVDPSNPSTGADYLLVDPSLRRESYPAVTSLAGSTLATTSHEQSDIPPQVSWEDPNCEDEPAGVWSEYVLRLWDVEGYQGRTLRFKDAILARLATDPIIREPTARQKMEARGYNSERLATLIRSRTSNFESAMIQRIGEVSPRECEGCWDRQGPWTRCVFVYDDSGNPASKCGNCTWGGYAKACSLYTEGPGSAPRNRKNKKPS